MIFADSSGFIAAFDSRDQRHAPAARAWRTFGEEGTYLLTTQLVLAETVTHLRRRAGWQASRQVGDALAAAWREFVRNPDPKLSLCDAASFVLMRERGVTSAFTFDQHISVAGFALVP